MSPSKLITMKPLLIQKHVMHENLSLSHFPAEAATGGVL